jgi:acyl-CoA reductase-like NAD-dependent aldehyde dehydrogenase
MSPAPNDSLAAVQAALAKARAAQPAWAALPLRERGRALRALARRAHRDESLARTIAAESGKPLFEAVAFEIAYLLEVTRFYTGRQGRRALHERRRSSLIFMHKRARVRYVPRGVVAVIGPWNFPLLNNFGDAVAPLLAGNSVLLKPSPYTPKTSRRMLELWRACGLPEDVFQVVEGEADVGEALVDGCDMVFFTGSVAVGHTIAGRAGARMIPCVAELGGKSAMIVLADADLAAAAHAAVWGAFAGAGQLCIRPERVLAVEGVADAFSRLVVDETRKLRLGREGDFDVGQVLLPAQVERCRAQVADALSSGARRLAGAEEATGVDFPPTVLDGVSPEAKVAREETFGPVLPIIRVADEEQAVAVANASHLGLSGSVWSRDQGRALSVARRLQAGSICINDVLVNYFFVSAPLGGRKLSGLGFRHGAEALRQFCHVQSIVEDRPCLRPVAAWIRRHLGFPYGRRLFAVLRWLMKAIYR